MALSRQTPRGIVGSPLGLACSHGDLSVVLPDAPPWIDGEPASHDVPASGYDCKDFIGVQNYKQVTGVL